MFLSLTYKLFCRMANIQKELPNSGNYGHPRISKCFHICFIKILCKWPDNYLGFVAFIIKAMPFRWGFNLGLHTSYHIYNSFFFFSCNALFSVKETRNLVIMDHETKKQQQEKLPNGAFILVSLGSKHL